MLAIKNAAVVESATAANSELSALVPLLWEIANLKRVKPANLPNSFATDLFRRAWLGILNGFDLREIAIETTASAVVAAQLGAIDAGVLRVAKLSEIEIQIVLERSFDLSAPPVEPALRGELRPALIKDFYFENAEPPEFVEKLIVQPRSGATKPGAPRLVFDQPENHAEHCISVAVFGVLLAPHFEANVETAFLAGLVHHFHNADLPDSGFAGEELLGKFLPKIFKNLRAKCMRELPENLHQPIWKIFAEIEQAETAEAKAFHAADVLDRVLQMRHHAEANEFTLKFALDEMELVHAGAVQSFHYEVLREARLI